jgi:hypothetical protein
MALLCQPDLRQPAMKKCNSGNVQRPTTPYKNKYARKLEHTLFASAIAFSTIFSSSAVCCLKFSATD